MKLLHTPHHVPHECVGLFRGGGAHATYYNSKKLVLLARLNGESCAPRTMSRLNIRVGGMVCQNCVQIIEKNLAKTDGVEAITVSLEDSMATVIYDPRFTNSQKLAEEIEELGFEAAPLSAPAAPKARDKCRIDVSGMTCNSCVAVIESGLGKIAGVESSAVSLEEGTAVVVYNSAAVTAEDFETAIVDMGFVVTGISSTFFSCYNKIVL